jgi:uncharacterized protein YerC
MFWIAQVVAVSFIIIFILHNLYFFFKDTLTVPKMKDMVKRPQQRYDALFRELRMRNEVSSEAAISEAAISAAAISAAAISAAPSSEANDDMKNELKRYLMELTGSTAQPQPQPQPHSLSNSNFIELGSLYQ